jgi:hypothetical protein
MFTQTNVLTERSLEQQLKFIEASAQACWNRHIINASQESFSCKEFITSLIGRYRSSTKELG